MLESLLGSSNLQDLATVCHQKTHGNPFFLLQYIGMLESHKWLEYSFATCSWKWDLELIQHNTQSSDNVVSVLHAKMESLSPSLQSLLFAASCLGASSEISLLQLVWKECGRLEMQKTSGDENFDSLLQTAMDHGFLELSGGSAYRFVHDKIQEAAAASTDWDTSSNSTVAEWRARVGWILVNEMDNHHLDDRPIFVAVDLLNEGKRPTLQSKKTALARWNLKASIKSRDVSAFAAAVNYADVGIALLPDGMTKWAPDLYSLTLDLYSIAAAMNGCVGNVLELHRLCTEVMELPQSSVLEKLPLYNTLIESLGNTGKNDEALKMCLGSLRLLGVKFQPSPLRITLSTLAQLLKMQQKLRSKRTKRLKCLPDLASPELLATMKQLDQTITFCHHCGSDLLPLVILRMVQLTYKHGISWYSLPGFACLAVLFVVAIEDFDVVRLLSEQIQQKLTEPSYRPVRSRTIMLLVGVVGPWITPMQSLFPSLLYGYESGMATGDIESSTWCIFWYLVVGYLSGRNLERLYSDCAIYIDQMYDLKRDLCAQHCCILWQTVENLIGSGEHTTLLEGNKLRGLPRDLPVLTMQMQVHQSRLYAVYGDYEAGAARALANGDSFKEQQPCDSLLIGDMFCSAISLFATSHNKSRRSPVKKYARKLHATFKAWFKKGNPNVQHCVLILDAEDAWLRNQSSDAVISLFRKGIVCAARHGFIQDAALGSERLAQYTKRVLNDQDATISHLQDAERFYAAWGAKKKCRMLREMYSDRPDRILVDRTESKELSTLDSMHGASALLDSTGTSSTRTEAEAALTTNTPLTSFGTSADGGRRSSLQPRRSIFQDTTSAPPNSSLSRSSWISLKLNLAENRSYIFFCLRGSDFDVLARAKAIS